MSNYVNKSLIELWDAATALHDLVEKARSMLPAQQANSLLDAIEASRPFVKAVEARWESIFGNGTGNVARRLTNQQPRLGLTNLALDRLSTHSRSMGHASLHIGKEPKRLRVRA